MLRKDWLIVVVGAILATVLTWSGVNDWRLPWVGDSRRSPGDGLSTSTTSVVGAQRVTTSYPQTTAPGSIPLKSLPITQGAPHGTGTVRINGSDYSDSMTFHNCFGPYRLDHGSVQYSAAGQYEELTALLGVTDRTPSSYEAEVEILADDVSVARSRVSAGSVEKLRVPIRGSTRITVLAVAVRGSACSDGSGVAIASPTVDRRSDLASPPKFPKLTYLALLRPVSRNFSSRAGGSVPVASDESTWSMALAGCRSSEPVEIEYALASQYDRFEAGFGISDLSRSNWSGRVSFVADGREVGQASVADRGVLIPISVELDRAARLQIRIVTSAGSECSAEPPMGPVLANARLFVTG